MFGKKPRQKDPSPDAPVSADMNDLDGVEASGSHAAEPDEAAEAAARAAEAAAASLASGTRRSDRRSERSKSAKPKRGGRRAKAQKEPKQPRDPKEPGIIARVMQDRSRRMRVMIWTATSVFLLLAITIVALGATSTYWFCANGCHKVQDDTIVAYQRSAHNRIHCMACHMPVGASPATFMVHKVEALGELYMTVTGNYSLPLNPENEVSLEMTSEQCTQCHTVNRLITPSPGIVIDHEAHAKAGVQCTICHNRVAHVEDFELKNKDPKSGMPNQKHDDFMGMTACFRCHTQQSGPAQANAEGTPKAPGKCSACHPKGFQLKPPSHLKPGFFPAMHGDLAKEAVEKVERAEAVERRKENPSAKSDAGAEGVAVAAEAEHLELPSPRVINECYTCHKESFCTDCHGAPMPHPAVFKKDHRKYAKDNAAACGQCHGGTGQGTCDGCHHGPATGWQYQRNLPWRLKQHPLAASKVGPSACFKCHKPTYCATCHVGGGVQPKGQ